MRLHRINALLLKYWYFTKNSMDRVFDMVYWPVIGTIVFGFTTLYIEKTAEISNIFIFLMGGVILWPLFERVQQDITVFILEDFWSRNIANSFTTPLRESEVFASLSLIGLIRSIFSFLIMFIIAFFAYKFNILQGGLISLVFIIPLFLFGWALGILISGLIFKFGLRIEIFAWGVAFLLQPIAAIYYLIGTLPAFLQKIALIFPLVHIFEGFRLAYNYTFSYSYLFWAFTLSIVYLVLGYIIFIKCIKNAKKTGLLTRH